MHFPGGCPLELRPVSRHPSVSRLGIRGIHRSPFSRLAFPACLESASPASASISSAARCSDPVDGCAPSARPGLPASRAPSPPSRSAIFARSAPVARPAAPLPFTPPALTPAGLILPLDGEMNTVTLPAAATVRDALIAAHGDGARLHPQSHFIHAGNEEPLDPPTALLSLEEPRNLCTWPLPEASPRSALCPPDSIPAPFLPPVAPQAKAIDDSAPLQTLQRATRHDIRVCRWCLNFHNYDLHRTLAALRCLAPPPPTPILPTNSAAPIPRSVQSKLVLLLPPDNRRHSATLAATAIVKDVWQAVVCLDAWLNQARFELCHWRHNPSHRFLALCPGSCASASSEAKLPGEQADPKFHGFMK
jgi:hypothetical protein